MQNKKRRFNGVFYFPNLPPQPVLLVTIAIERQGEFEVEVVHAFALVEAVGVVAQPVAGNFKLHAALRFGDFNRLGKYNFANAFTAALRCNGKFHNFRDARGVVQLLFKTQVQHAAGFAAFFVNQAVVIFISKLLQIY